MAKRLIDVFHEDFIREVKEARNYPEAFEKANQKFAEKHGFAAFFEGGSGISHQVLMEQGYVLPGSLVVANEDRKSVV